MDYRVFDHTADLGVEVTADSREAVYAGAALALIDLLTEPETIRRVEQRAVTVAGEDPDDLLVNFLREVLYAWNGEGFLMNTCKIRMAAPCRLKALLKGESYDPERHRIRKEIKAVTYHLASVRNTGKVWVARAVFDV